MTNGKPQKISTGQSQTEDQRVPRKARRKTNQELRDDNVVLREDNVKLVVENWLLGCSKDLKSRTRWMTPLGIFLCLVIPLVTSDFKKLGSVSADQCKAGAIILAFGAFVWLVIWVVQACKSRSLEVLQNDLKERVISRFKAEE